MFFKLDLEAEQGHKLKECITGDDANVQLFKSRPLGIFLLCLFFLKWTIKLNVGKILPVLDQGYDLWVRLSNDALSIHLHNTIPCTESQNKKVSQSASQELTVKESNKKQNHIKQ